jgi:uncharacterized membrane protein
MNPIAQTPGSKGRTEHAGSPAGWLSQLGPFMALAAAALYLRARWPDLPQRIAMHYGLDGRPNAWMPRSALAVYGPLLLAALVAGSMAFVGWLQHRATRPIHPGAVVHYTEVRYRHGILVALLSAEYVLVATVVWLSLLPLRADGGHIGLEGAALATVTLVYIVWLGVYLRRLRPRGHPASGAGLGTSGHDPTAEEHWRAGVFYVNPDDPSLLVPKRFGIGYTLNFARTEAWLVMILLSVVLPALVFWAVLKAS